MALGLWLLLGERHAHAHVHEALEHEQQALVARMSSADYHKRGADAIKADRKRAADLEHLLAAKFERWSALDQKIASGNG